MTETDAIELHSQRAAEALRRGGIVIYPTEGVFGIGCIASNHDAVARLLQLKQRDPGKGFILIASNLAQLSDWIAEIPKAQRERVLSSWPGAVTWVLPAAAGVSNQVTGGRDSVAVRVSAHPFVKALCDEINSVLISTSANLSGQPTASSAEELQATFGDQVDYIVPLMPGELNGPTPIFDARTGQQLR